MHGRTFWWYNCEIWDKYFGIFICHDCKEFQTLATCAVRLIFWGCLTQTISSVRRINVNCFLIVYSPLIPCQLNFIILLLNNWDRVVWMVEWNKLAKIRVRGPLFKSHSCQSVLSLIQIISNELCRVLSSKMYEKCYSDGISCFLWCYFC